jgi:eukaryotic-like serine/threonine-protein kinase
VHDDRHGRCFTGFMPVFTSGVATVRLPKLGQARPAAPGRGKYPTPLRVSVAVDVDDETATTVDRYRIGELLGRGGMATVFAVTHPDRPQPLAMKVVTDRRLRDDVAFRAIHAHAKAASLLTSPHVVRTVDAGRLPSGEPFIVMEKLAGEDLAARLARTGSLPPAEAFLAVRHACAGLADAHAAGLVHGDVKPGNLVMTTDPFGSPCLKVIDLAPAVPSATDPDDPLVTFSPGYAAPEQLSAGGPVDARADVFALGVVLHELLTGERPYAASGPRGLATLLHAMATPPASVRGRLADAPASLDEVLHRCLAFERDARFASVKELSEALVVVEKEWLHATEARQRAAVTARNDVPPSVRLGAGAPRDRRWRRTLFLGALGPASALVSMTLVRVILALIH